MTEKPESSKPMGFSELREYLRHRHPMLILDRVLEYQVGKSLKALLNVSGNTDCIAGHFPGRAIYPASHLLQAFSQCGIILYQLSTSPLKDDEITLVGSLAARFFRIVVPGDQVVFEVTADRLMENTLHFSGSGRVSGTRVAAFRATLVRTCISALGTLLW